MKQQFDPHFAHKISLVDPTLIQISDTRKLIKDYSLNNSDHLQTNNSSARAIVSVCGTRICFTLDLEVIFPLPIG